MSNLANRRLAATLAIVMVLVLPACGGGSHNKGKTIGGSLAGLANGLSVTLLNNGGNALTVTANGSFVFTTKVKKKAAYAVTVGTQPVGQTCTVVNGTGVVHKANITNVAVVCTSNLYTVGGTLSGLGSGLSVGLLNNAGNALTLNANGSFAFTTALVTGATYAVSVGTQPPGQMCTVSNGSGTVGSSNVTNVAVSCTFVPTSFSIGGTLTGLAAGRSVTLLNNGVNALTRNANGSFAFTTALAGGAGYAVTVGTQPAGQTCNVANGSGTVASINVTNVAVTCTDILYTVGGTVTGLLAGRSVTLLNKGGNALTRNSNGSFTFTTGLASGATYTVTVGTQPAGQMCTVASGSGTLAVANVTNVAVACTSNSYTVGGTLSGLGSGLSVTVLNNGGDSMTRSADGAFTFATAVASGEDYAVTVGTQPPGQVCTVGNGTGTIVAANITTANVACRDGNLWAWKGGANLLSPSALYGTKGVAAANNMPGGRKWTASWQDPSGNFWMFGGHGYGATIAAGNLNDLWQFDTTTGLWTWVSGSNVINAAAVYGTLGVANATNVPGARESAVSWTDSAGNLWLFGGRVNLGAGTGDYLNDLWVYRPGTGEWTWAGGPNTANSAGTYGTLDTESPANWPGARYGALAWTDSAGSIWLFGGYGLDSAGAQLGYLNDLWKYNPANGRWTWKGGSSTYGAAGDYGSLGTPAAANVPGARAWDSGWRDNAGNLWLFGGLAASGTPMNDLWRYSPSSSQWTWVSGANVGGAKGVYGTQGSPAAGNVPGARSSSMAWADGSGTLWLVGGSGFDSVGAEVAALNDLWKFDTATGHWTWVNGSKLAKASSAYTNQGTPSISTRPGARNGGATWIDSNGHAWLFGGAAYDSTGSYYPDGYNDLFEYFP